MDDSATSFILTLPIVDGTVILDISLLESRFGVGKLSISRDLERLLTGHRRSGAAVVLTPEQLGRAAGALAFLFRDPHLGDAIASEEVRLPDKSLAMTLLCNAIEFPVDLSEVCDEKDAAFDPTLNALQ